MKKFLGIGRDISTRAIKDYQWLPESFSIASVKAGFYCRGLFLSVEACIVYILLWPNFVCWVRVYIGLWSKYCGEC